MRAGAREIPERHFDVADAVAKVAAELDTTPTAVALAWVLGRRNVTSVIIGPRTLHQYSENAAGFSLALPDESVRILNQASKPTSG
jgi:aryl-alcohol dehydrogenase-like predicted oxidoreductase